MTNGRNTQESLLEGMISSEAENDLQETSNIQKDRQSHREVFVFVSIPLNFIIPYDIVQLINEGND